MDRSAPRQQSNELGQRLCRVPTCLKLVPKGRKSYCSKECATAFEIAYFPARARWHVFQRDNGICAKCRCDTEKLRRVLDHVRYWDTPADEYRGFRHRRGRGDYQAARAVAQELGFKGFIYDGELWQADHVIEVARGGWGLGLEFLRTLCTPCHKEETARLARERAEERRAAKAIADSPLFNSEVA